MLSQLVQGSIMEKDLTMDSNPAIIDMYLSALRQRESSGNYQVLHAVSVIEDLATGKPIRVQGLGAYGILDTKQQILHTRHQTPDFLH